MERKVRSSIGPKGQTIVISAEDGRKLSGTWWSGTQAHDRSVIILPGLAIPQGYLGGFSQFLANYGWGVLTFDYRGVGRSRLDARDEGITLDEWAHLDIPAAIKNIRSRCEPRFLGAFAHSIGGQLLGQSSAAGSIDGAVLVAAQRGIPRLYQGTAWFAIWYAYTVFPLLIRVLGHLPASRYTLPQPCPAGAILQWVQWGRSGVFTDMAGRNIEPRYAALRIPITAVTVADDQFAPAAAVQALVRLYCGAALNTETIRPQAYGSDYIGHFGFFHRHAPKVLWTDAEGWLRDLATKRPNASIASRHKA